MDASEIETMMTMIVRKAMAAEARQAGMRRHSHRHLRWNDRAAVWGRSGRRMS